MLAETINGIEITVNESVIHQAVEEFLNTHMFKEPIKIVRLGARELVFTKDNSDHGMVYKITVETLLQRLAGETIH